MAGGTAVAPSARRYERPGWFVARVGNPIIGWLAERLGVSLAGAQVLAVRGRRSGRWRTTPVNPLTVDGQHYLVAPRGETQWVRNLRVAGAGELRLGNRRWAFRATELPDDEKPPILRAYLRRWHRQVAKQFAVSGPDAPEADFRRIASDHPVFRLAAAPAAPQGRQPETRRR
jgi:deazaflavin-dependent oxidoreductase (nitroreductase family)